MIFKSKNVDMIHGKLAPSIIVYAVPIIIGSLIQVLFNAADIAVLGNMADDVAVASVGATAPIVGLIVNSFIGLSNGTSILLSRYVGSYDNKNIRRCIDTSIMCALIVGVILTIVGLFTSRILLIKTDCPAECLEGADLYLKLYFAAIPAIMIYNFGAAIIRATGDSQTPLYYLIACGLLNIVMNVALCFILTQKVAAVAIATLSSQVLGAVLVMIKLLKTEGVFKIEVKHLAIHPKMFGKIIMLGLPGALNTSLYCISNLQIQSAINSFGPAAIAGNTTCSSIEGLASSFTGAFANASLIFIGQNIGAGDKKRVSTAIKYCLLFAFISGIVLGDGLFLIGKPLLSLYIPGATEAIEAGYIRMHYVLALYFIAAVNGVLGSALQSFGYSTLPMINSIVTVLLFRVFWMFCVYPNYHTLDNLYFCYSCSWTLNLIAATVTFLIVYKRYKKGKVRTL